MQEILTTPDHEIVLRREIITQFINSLSAEQMNDLDTAAKTFKYLPDTGIPSDIDPVPTPETPRASIIETSGVEQPVQYELKRTGNKRKLRLAAQVIAAGIVSVGATYIPDALNSSRSTKVATDEEIAATPITVRQAEITTVPPSTSTTTELPTTTSEAPASEPVITVAPAEVVPITEAPHRKVA